MSERKSYASAAAWWLAFVMIFFWPAIFQGQVLAPLDILESLLKPWATSESISVHNAYTYDAISQYLPYNWSVAQSLIQDGYVGWNPYTHSGTSIVENTMICPGDWHHQLYRFMPFWTAWNAGIIIQFALAGLGMLALLKSQKIPAPHALLAAVAFGFYSQFTVWIYHRWILGAMCWAPWIVWALLRTRKSGRIVDLASIAFIALAFRGGHLQTCIFVVLLVVGLALADWWQSPRRWDLRQTVTVILPYAVSGIFASLLALDVVIQTVPALLEGKREMDSRSWVEALTGLPTLVTSVFPYVLGSPQGLDVMKSFKLDLFSIKFMGAIALLLASLACFHRKAPLTARTLFLIGLAVPFTPLDQWLYSRFTVVFALGGAWLAAWYLSKMALEPPSVVWKRATIALALVIGLWLLASIAIAVKEPWVLAKLQVVVTENLPAGKASRMEWMLSRADAFLADSYVWTPRNQATLVLLLLGLYACSRIHCGNANAHRFGWLLAFCAFGEMLIFAAPWVSFSAIPQGNQLYAEPAWATRIKHEAGNGTVHLLDRSDFDYMQLNTPSVHGIRFSDGYETVTPRRIDPAAGASRDSTRCNASGISHLLVSKEKDPGTIPGWEKSIDSDELVLYKNPLFQSIYTAAIVSGGALPLFPISNTPNRRELDLPAGTQSLTFTESYNAGWKYSLDGQSWLPVVQTGNHGMRIDLTSPTASDSTLLQLRYAPTYQSHYRIGIGLVVVGLLGFSVYRWKTGNHLRLDRRT